MGLFIQTVYSVVCLILLIECIDCSCGEVNCNFGVCREENRTTLCVCNPGYVGDYCTINSTEPSCQRVREQGYTWPDTSVRDVVVINCNSSGSSNLQGAISRSCGAGGMWQSWDLRNCTNVFSNDNTGELVLSIVTYILSTVSLIALFTSIFIFLLLGKELYKKDIYVVHLNYAISLTISMALFVFGVQSARDNRIACGIIAGVLHYAFLSVFTWSFCESIIVLYLLFVLLARRKIYPYLLVLGWGLPIPVVVVTASARWYNYGVLGQYCWLSTENGVIWGFIAPALTSVLINVILVIVTIARIATGLNVRTRQVTRVRQAKVAAIGILILVPLLGIPCIVALPNLFVSLPNFQWIFVLLNTPQGVIFFLLYVVNNRELVKKAFRIKGDVRSPRNTQLQRGSDYSPRTSTRYKKQSVRTADQKELEETAKETDPNSNFKDNEAYID